MNSITSGRKIMEETFTFYFIYFSFVGLSKKAQIAFIIKNTIFS